MQIKANKMKQLWCILMLALIRGTWCTPNEEPAPLVTQTIYGFLDFTTTIANTVMIFSPQSSPVAELKTTTSEPTTTNVIKTKPLPNTAQLLTNTEETINPTKLEPATTEVVTAKKSTSAEKVTNITGTSTSLMDKIDQIEVEEKSNNNDQAHEEDSTSLSKNESETTIESITLKQLNEDLKEKSLEDKNKIINNTPALPIENDLYVPEYNLLSRQPPQFVEETYRLVNLKSSNKISPQKSAFLLTADPISSDLTENLKTHVNSIGKAVSSSSSTTTTTTTGSSAATSSSSGRTHKSNKKNKIRPSSSTPHVLKTAAPLPATGSRSNNNSNKITNRVSNSATTVTTATTSGRAKSHKKTSHRSNASSSSKSSNTNNNNNEEVVTVRSTSVRSKPKSRKNKNKHGSSGKPKYSTTTTPSTNTGETTVRRTFRPKTQQQFSQNDYESSSNGNQQNGANLNGNSNNLHITKLNRAPGRWQYKTTPKPRVAIRKSTTIEGNGVGPLGLSNVSLAQTTLSSSQSPLHQAAFGDGSLPNDNISNNFIITNQSDLESSGSQNGAIVNNIEGTDDDKQKFFTETINVEISTPVDFKDTYYEIATIKKPFVFQAGILKKTRYITVTSTLEKYLTMETSTESVRNDEEPLTENILANTLTQKPEVGLLTGSIVTLNPIFVETETETPILETVVESFSVVNQKLKTQILPIVRMDINETSLHTLIQTIDLTTLITVTKTTSPEMETKEFNGFKDIVANLDEAGSEINLDLEFGDEGNHETNTTAEHPQHPDETDSLLEQRVNNLNNKSELNLPSLPILPEIPNLPTPTLPLATVITNTRPVIKLETIWESYIIPLTNGQSTSYRTLSKSKGVIEKTEYAIDTTTLSVPPPILPPSTINPFLFPQQLPQFQTITSPLIQQAIVTKTESKILKLTFGAKTAYTTLYSTQVVPTLQTMYVTTSIPIQPSANPFPGFFPQPYNPYAYLG